MSRLEEATRFLALMHASRRAARGKRGRPEVDRFLMDAEHECLRLRRALRLPLDHPSSWHPSPARRFVVRDPKPRRITAVPFPDRVVHHALCAQVESDLERYAIHDSYACRPGKGTHAALERARRFSRCRPWVLKADIAGYFASIPHGPLLENLRRRIGDAALVARFARVLQGPGNGPGRGLAIGSLVSQHLANLYLGTLDHWIKDDSGWKCYLRYMDDFLVFGTRAELRALLPRLRAFLGDRLGLALNERRSQIMPVRHGVPLLGFRVRPDRIRPRAQTWRRTRRRFRAVQRALSEDRITEAEAARKASAIFAHILPYTTRQARRRLLEGAGQQRQPRGSWRRLGQPGLQPARVEPQLEAPLQPQRQPRLPPRQLGATGLQAGSRSDAPCSRTRRPHLGADPAPVLSAPLTRGSETPPPGGGVSRVAPGHPPGKGP